MLHAPQLTVLNSSITFQMSTGISHCTRNCIQCVAKPLSLRNYVIFDLLETTGQVSLDRNLEST